MQVQILERKIEKHLRGLRRVTLVPVPAADCVSDIGAFVLVIRCVESDRSDAFAFRAPFDGEIDLVARPLFLILDPSRDDLARLLSRVWAPRIITRHAWIARIFMDVVLVVSANLAQ